MNWLAFPEIFQDHSDRQRDAQSVRCVQSTSLEAPVVQNRIIQPHRLGANPTSPIERSDSQNPRPASFWGVDRQIGIQLYTRSNRLYTKIGRFAVPTYTLLRSPQTHFVICA